MVAIANLLQTAYHRAYITCFHFLKLSTSDNCHDKVATATIVGIVRGQESWMLCASVVIFSILIFSINFTLFWCDRKRIPDSERVVTLMMTRKMIGSDDPSNIRVTVFWSIWWLFVGISVLWSDKKTCFWI